MSVEKAILFRKYPALIKRLIKEENDGLSNIVLNRIYYERSDKNLRMNTVVLSVDYVDGPQRPAGGSECTSTGGLQIVQR